MKLRLLFVVLLHVSQHASGVKVYEGVKSVLLPCQVPADDSRSSTSVVWDCDEFDNPTVHVRLQSGDELRGQNNRYTNRTSMRADALQTGDLSLILRNPTASDSGNYTCIARSYGRDLSRAKVQLRVKEPPLWPWVLAVTLLILVLVIVAFGVILYCERKRLKAVEAFLARVKGVSAIKQEDSRMIVGGYPGYHRMRGDEDEDEDERNRENGEACVVGHPGGGVKKMSPKCVVEKERRENNESVEDCEEFCSLCEMNQQIKNDPYENIYVTYNTLMYHGSSGSPVFDADGRVFALHSGGFFYGFPNLSENVIEYAFPLLTIFENFVDNLKKDGYGEVLERVVEEAKGNPHLENIIASVVGSKQGKPGALLHEVETTPETLCADSKVCAVGVSGPSTPHNLALVPRGTANL
ncbi:hypothetical protein ACER0C_003269 [Sarotherodon galilaeus]